MAEPLRQLTSVQRELIAFGLAPVPAIWLLAWLQMWSGLVDSWRWQPVTILIAYVLELLIGFPIHTQLLARRLTGLWHYVAAGGIVATTLPIVFGPLYWPYYFLGVKLLLPSGMVWGATFWFIAVRR